MGAGLVPITVFIGSKLETAFASKAEMAVVVGDAKLSSVFAGRGA